MGLLLQTSKGPFVKHELILCLQVGMRLWYGLTKRSCIFDHCQWSEKYHSMGKDGANFEVKAHVVLSGAGLYCRQTTTTDGKGLLGEVTLHSLRNVHGLI